MFRSFLGKSTKVLRSSENYYLIPENVRFQQTAVKYAKPRSFRKETNDGMKWFLLAMPVTSFGLGCWQVYRLNWKLDLIKQLSEKSNAIPDNIPVDFTELKNMEFKPVKIRGEFLHDKEILIGPRSLIEPDVKYTGSMAVDTKKNQGWLVITPFKLASTGEVILVNRGWIPQTIRPKQMRASSLVKGEVELQGVVRLTEKRPPFMPANNPEKGSWFYRDLEEMSSYLDCAPVWLDARGVSDPPPGWPIPNQTRVTLRNEHMSYLITWFSLSAVTAFMWHRHFIRRLPLV